MMKIFKYDEFNEGLFSRNKYDEIAIKLFNRIKEIFNIDDLNFNSDRYRYIYTYNLEETSANKGYIKVKVIAERAFFGYELKVDGENINCSRKLIRKIFNYFSNMKENNKYNKIKDKVKDI